MELSWGIGDEEEGEEEGLERKKRERERVPRRVNEKKRAGTEQSDRDVLFSAIALFRSKIMDVWICQNKLSNLKGKGKVSPHLDES
jgi:hypothetical protein